MSHDRSDEIHLKIAHPFYQHDDSPLPFALSVDRPHNLRTRFANMAIADHKPRNSSKNMNEVSRKYQPNYYIDV
jgi:hypothetical protein